MAAKKEKKTIPEEKRKQYEALVRAMPGLEIKSNFGFPYTSKNGHMFSLLSKSGFVGIRLPRKEREQFLADYDTCLYQPEPGPLLKEYVTVPHALLEDTAAILPYLEMSYAYVSSLKPKKTK